MEDFFQELKNTPQRLCKKCAKCCKILDCQHLREDNLCSVYENRPEVCRSFPYSPWEDVPQGCGFEGWLFKKGGNKATNQETKRTFVIA